MKMSIKDFINWIINFFKFTGISPSHVVVPDILVGSPEWLQPTVDNQLKNWFPYFSLPYTSQVAPSGFYEDNCVVRASIQSIESILNYYIKNSLFPTTVSNFLKKYYCNSQGYVKLSVRYHSKLCNVKQGIGTDLATVLNGFSKFGLVPENVYPDPIENYNWDIYMQDIPQGIENYGAYSTTFFKIIWNALWSNNWGLVDVLKLKTTLISSPVIFASQIGNLVNNVEQPTPIKTYQHCRVIGLVDELNKQIGVLDNYEINGSELRKLDYSFPIATGVILQVKII